MKRFLQTAFKITLFQIFIILFFGALKYVIVTYQLDDKIQKPFIWVCFGAAILLLVALSIIGTIEKQGESYKNWRAKTQKTRKEEFIATFVSWGLALPAGLAYALFLYLIAPTTWYLFIALYAGIVIKNITQFFSKKQTKVDHGLN